MNSKEKQISKMIPITLSLVFILILLPLSIGVFVLAKYTNFAQKMYSFEALGLVWTILGFMLTVYCLTIPKIKQSLKKLNFIIKKLKYKKDKHFYKKLKYFYWLHSITILMLVSLSVSLSCIGSQSFLAICFELIPSLVNFTNIICSIGITSMFLCYTILLIMITLDQKINCPKF